MSEFKFNFPSSNPRIIRSEEYWNDVIKKFPCPAGYEEIQYGYSGKAFDRGDLTTECFISPVDNINHDIGMVDVVKEGSEYSCLAVWFVRFLGE